MGKWRLADSLIGVLGGVLPHIFTILLLIAKRRAAVAVSGDAAERPMEPEAIRAPLRLCGPIFPGQYCNPIVFGEKLRLVKTQRRNRLTDRKKP